MIHLKGKKHRDLRPGWVLRGSPLLPPTPSWYATASKSTRAAWQAVLLQGEDADSTAVEAVRQAEKHHMQSLEGGQVQAQPQVQPQPQPQARARAQPAASLTEEVSCLAASHIEVPQLAALSQADSES